MLNNLFKSCALCLAGPATLGPRSLPCVATFLAFLQQNWPALALPPHFCSRTALRCRFPRISAAKLPCVATALRFHCAVWPVSRVATCSVALCDGVTLVYYIVHARRGHHARGQAGEVRGGRARGPVDLHLFGY